MSDMNKTDQKENAKIGENDVNEFLGKINDFTKMQNKSPQEIAVMIVDLKRKIGTFGSCVGPRNAVIGTIFLSFDYILDLLLSSELRPQEFLAGLMKLIDLTADYKGKNSFNRAILDKIIADFSEDSWKRGDM